LTRYKKMLDMATAEGLLTPIGADLIKMRTSLYADDAMLFMQPNASNLSDVWELLIHFGEATSLCTNTHKSEVFSIRCEGLNISRIIEQMPLKQGHLPCKYMGHPLRLGIVVTPRVSNPYD
jgi:hypothetical protein